MGSKGVNKYNSSSELILAMFKNNEKIRTKKSKHVNKVGFILEIYLKGIWMENKVISIKDDN